MPLQSCLRRSIKLFLLLILTLSACQFPSGEPEQTAGPAPVDDWFSVYFTDPGSPQSRSLRGGPDAHLAEAIEAAQASVDLAVLDLDLWSIRDALLDAHRRGVTVRLVVESEYRNGRELQELLEAGIEVLGDRREGLMHNKFTIIDRQEVWTGSMNYTINDAYRNNNNLIRIRSEELARNYLAEFEEMFTDDRFGPGSPANTPASELVVNGTRMQICFAPDDGCAGRLIEAIENARQSVHFMAYSFTADALADALQQRFAAGVTVAGVMEAGQVRSNAGTDFDRFRAAGMDVHTDGNPRNMHHKAMVIDGRIVVTGSYNFSHYAETRNDENLLLIENAEIAALYESEFARVLAEAKE